MYFQSIPSRYNSQRDNKHLNVKKKKIILNCKNQKPDGPLMVLYNYLRCITSWKVNVSEHDLMNDRPEWKTTVHLLVILNIH